MALTPMMRQYLETKENYKDSILFYRLGDFYEMFFDDALTASKVLDLVLTGRDCGLSERAPMCGVPHHAAEGYIAKLIENGYKVAVCEQLTQPDGKNLVVRDVVKVITAGTVMEDSMLSEDKNNYICCIYMPLSGAKREAGLAWADITTGEFSLTELSVSADFSQLTDYIAALSPSEIICNSLTYESSIDIKAIKHGLFPKFNRYYDDVFDYQSAKRALEEQFSAEKLKDCGCLQKKCGIAAAGALLSYLNETQKRSLKHMTDIRFLQGGMFMMLDFNTRRNLELTKTMRDGKKYGSLLWLLGNTATGMGARSTNAWIEKPLTDKEEIVRRQDAVQEFIGSPLIREDFRGRLSSVRDLERLAARIGYGSITPKDCAQIRASVFQLPGIKNTLNECRSQKVVQLTGQIHTLEDIAQLLESAISDNPPQTVKDGGVIKEGYNSELDEIRSAASGGKQWLAKLEAAERESTGIKSLKIGFNKVFGYYIEVSRSFADQVPINYIRKQTLANAERYITEDLKRTEDKILGAEERSISLETKLFGEITQKISLKIPEIQATAQAIAQLDSLATFAETAVKNNYCKPEIGNADSALSIKDGRHPVVELLSKSGGFVSNDTYLDNKDDRFMILTGPNMAGKSTYMRQVALITLMAHLGSFVPATAAHIPVTDRIFTRIGATDNLAFDQSTFMVEMTEVANILQNATSRSLVILDEVGRGTSTFDGLSIAWAVTEYITKNLQCKTMFATHYHELTELEGTLEGVKNYGIAVKEMQGTIVFLRKILRGGAHKSFGIEVAALAGLPKPLLDRAKKILLQLEEADINNPKNKSAQYKIDFNAAESDIDSNKPYKDFLHYAADIETDTLSPIQALNTLHELTIKAKRLKQED